jgi:hypothetical protein
VKRNVDRRMKIKSDIIVHFFVFYEHDDNTSKHFCCHPVDHKEKNSAQSEQL